MKKKLLDKIYKKIVDQSKKTFFFDKILVPKSFESRLEVFQLNLIIILWYLKKKDSGKKNSFNLIQIFIRDLEYAIRELGVSDLSVGRKIRTLTENFYGRLYAYTECFEDNKEKKLEEKFKKNFKFKGIDYKKLLNYAEINIDYFKTLKILDFQDLDFEYKDNKI